MIVRQSFERIDASPERRDAALRLGQDAQNEPTVGERIGSQQWITDLARDALGLLEIGRPLAGIAQPQETAEPVQQPAALIRS